MTGFTPPPTQTNKKAWWALIIPQIPAIVMTLLQIGGTLPAPYGVIFGGLFSIVGAITGLAVHQVSNAPKGSVLVPVPISLPPAGSGWPES